MEIKEYSKQVLKKYWKHNEFRPLQQEIISSVMEGNDTLALLPTGGGKSICFQVPALMREGICLVISPLIALMKDQVEQLLAKGIKAAAIFSGMHKKEIDIILDNCIYGNIKFLYVSPERLKTEIFIERVKRMKVNLIAVDEAHCISQWGYDFRPPYLEIAELRKILPTVNFIALTATATKEVKQDIQEKLKFQNAKVFQKSFARDNLSYSVFNIEDKDKKLLEIFNSVNGSGIVYVRNRRKTRTVANFLMRNGISANFYHAGMEHSDRSKIQEDWIKNRIRVIVATNAFGMGIDKPDVRVVVHLDLTSSLEAYYQEAGRGGRDEKKAYAVVLYHQGDLEDIKGYLLYAYPPVDFIKKVYQSIANYYKIAVGSSLFASYDFDISELAKLYQLPPLETYHAVKKLQDEGFFELNETFFKPSRIMILMDHQELYKFQIANALYDPLIKSILRMYGGELFTGFINISESQLANFLGNTSVNEIEKMLKALHQMEVLYYDPKKDKPQITFLTPRLDATTLPINIKEYETKKERDEQKVESVINYVTHNQRCRSLLLLEYFNEVSYRKCGICDVCLASADNIHLEDPKIKAGFIIIKNVIKEQALSLENLVEKVKPKDKEKFFDVVKLLIDQQYLEYDKNGRIKLGNKVMGDG